MKGPERRERKEVVGLLKADTQSHNKPAVATFVVTFTWGRTGGGGESKGWRTGWRRHV